MTSFLLWLIGTKIGKATLAFSLLLASIVLLRGAINSVIALVPGMPVVMIKLWNYFDIGASASVIVGAYISRLGIKIAYAHFDIVSHL